MFPNALPIAGTSPKLRASLKCCWCNFRAAPYSPAMWKAVPRLDNDLEMTRRQFYRFVFAARNVEPSQDISIRLDKMVISRRPTSPPQPCLCSPGRDPTVSHTSVVHSQNLALHEPRVRDQRKREPPRFGLRSHWRDGELPHRTPQHGCIASGNDVRIPDYSKPRGAE